MLVRVTILSELYQFLFLFSIIFMVYILGNLAIKIYGKFKLGQNVTFVLNTFEKIMLWISVSIFLSYLI